MTTSQTSEDATAATAKLILIKGSASFFEPVLYLHTENFWLFELATAESNRGKWCVRNSEGKAVAMKLNGRAIVPGNVRYLLKDNDVISYLPAGWSDKDQIQYQFTYIDPIKPDVMVGPLRSQPNSFKPAPSGALVDSANKGKVVVTSTKVKVEVPPNKVKLQAPSHDTSFNSLPDLDEDKDIPTRTSSRNSKSSQSQSQQKFRKKPAESTTATTVPRKRTAELSPVKNSKNTTIPDKKAKIENNSNIKTAAELNELKNELEKTKKQLADNTRQHKKAEIEMVQKSEEILCLRRDVDKAIIASRTEVCKKVKELVDTELSCPLCYEVFVEPTVIDCGHTFCKHCLEECTKTKIECPYCGQKFQHRSRNFGVYNFLAKYHGAFPASTT